MRFISLIPFALACKDGDKSAADDSAPVAGPSTFTEDYVESGLIEALDVRHGAEEFESYYDGSFPILQPIVVEVRYGYDATGFAHPLYWGVVNADHTRACNLGVSAVEYGGPDVDPDDAEARSFVLTGVVDERCREDLGEDGPFHVWVGANRLIEPNGDVSEDEIEVGVNHLAFLESGNVQIFDEDGTDLSGLARNAGCQRLAYDEASDSWVEQEGTEGCATSLDLVESAGPNLLMHDLRPLSSLGLLETETDDAGETTCVQQKGSPLLQVNTEVGLYGAEPEEDADGLEVNALSAPLTLSFRLCLGADLDDVPCDTDGGWISLLANPLADNPREAGDADTLAELEEQFGDIDDGATDDVGLEEGGFNIEISDLAYLDQRPVAAALYLPADACTADLLAELATAGPGVLEACVVPPDDALDQAYGRSEDDCRRVEVDVGSLPPPPATTVVSVDKSFSESFGTSAVTLALDGGFDMTVASDPEVLATATFNSDLAGLSLLDGDLDLYTTPEEGLVGYDLALELFSESVFSSGTEDADDMGVTLSQPLSGYEGCVDTDVSFWIFDLDLEYCYNDTLSLTTTLVAGYSNATSPYKWKVYVGLEDTGVDATTELSVDYTNPAGIGSISVTFDADPFLDVTVYNDAYLIFYTGTREYKVATNFNVLQLGYEALDVYLKLKGCFAGYCDSTKVFDCSGFSDEYTVYSKTANTGGRY